MNEVMKNILTRRSVRAFSDRPVERDVLDDIVKAALCAPSAMNRQTWKFTVVTNGKKIKELADAIMNTHFSQPSCPVYQNVNAQPVSDPEEIKKNLIAQLTASVRWTQTVQNMLADGASSFLESGPGNVLQGLIKKVSTEVETAGMQ